MITYPPMSLGLHSLVRSSHKAKISGAPLGTLARMVKIAHASPCHPIVLQLIKRVMAQLNRPSLIRRAIRSCLIGKLSSSSFDLLTFKGLTIANN
jgi:hypothetical protein